VPQMREKGLSESQIVGELIDIEIEVFRQSELAT
jgi:hypothetical protein